MSAPSGTLGAKVTLRTNCMATTGTGPQITHSLEVSPSTSSSTFAKLGILRGRDFDGNATAPIPRRYFRWGKLGAVSWAYSSANYALNTEVDATIWKPDTSTSRWEMWFDNARPTLKVPGLFVGPARLLATTTTSTDTTAHTYGSDSRLYYYNLSGTIMPEWSGASSQANLASNGAGYSSWHTPQWWARAGVGSCDV